MNPEQARQLVGETFTRAFDETRILDFIRIPLSFEWDEQKVRANLAKHGVVTI